MTCWACSSCVRTTGGVNADGEGVLAVLNIIIIGPPVADAVGVGMEVGRGPPSMGSISMGVMLELLEVA